MIQTRRHTGALPDPARTLEHYFEAAGISLIRAVFENSFFADPVAVRARTPYFPDRARFSRTHYPGLQKGAWALWVDENTRVRLDDNSRAQLAWERYTGRRLSRGSGFGLRHIWGHPWNPIAFTAGWNLAYMPHWAGMLTESQHPNELIQAAVRQASWDLFFRDDPVCAPPAFVADPGLDLQQLLGGRPLLVLGAYDSAGRGGAPSTTSFAKYEPGIGSRGQTSGRRSPLSGGRPMSRSDHLTSRLLRRAQCDGCAVRRG